MQKMEFSTVCDIAHLPLAATIFAHDVPLHAPQPYSVESGDGIRGKKIIFHFAGSAADSIKRKWFDPGYLAANPTDSVAVCLDSFSYLETLRHYCKTEIGVKRAAVQLQTATTNIRIASILARLGHEPFAYHGGDFIVWCFNPSAAADLALLEDPNLYDMMPTAPIAYAKAALFSHMAMLELVNKTTHYRIRHKGREAVIGANLPKDQLAVMEKLINRK
jgi:hypothetical protein